MNPFLRALARRQCGVFTRAQSLRCGMSGREIDARLASGDWMQRYPTVYVCGGTPWTAGADAWAAVLRIGPPVALADAWAAWAVNLDRAPELPSWVQVVVPATRRRDVAPGVAVTRSRLPLMPVLVNGLPVTPPARVLRQLAARYPRARVRDMVHHALRKRAVTMSALAAELGRGVPGAARLRRVLLEVAPGYQVVWEGQLHRELLRIGVPLTPQVRVAVAPGYPGARPGR